MKKCIRIQRPQMEYILLSLIIDSDREVKWTNTTNYRLIERIQSKWRRRFIITREECIDWAIQWWINKITDLFIEFHIYSIYGESSNTLKRHHCHHWLRWNAFGFHSVPTYSLFESIECLQTKIISGSNKTEKKTQRYHQIC